MYHPVYSKTIESVPISGGGGGELLQVDAARRVNEVLLPGVEIEVLEIIHSVYKLVYIDMMAQYYIQFPSDHGFYPPRGLPLTATGSRSGTLAAAACPEPRCGTASCAARQPAAARPPRGPAWPGMSCLPRCRGWCRRCCLRFSNQI